VAPEYPGVSGRVPLFEQRRRLEGGTGSPAAARRLVAELIQQAERDEWLDAGELAVSEVVTNAALHAHTEIELRVVIYTNELYVEVRDFNPILPVARHYEDEATTGRGMGLVSAITHAHGVHSLGPDGKTVWFCIGDTPDDASSLLESWDLDAHQDEPACTEVVLRAMPPTLWLAARQHHDALTRELVLYSAEHPAIDADTATADRARATISARLVAAVEEAQAAGTARPATPHGTSSLPWVPDHLDLVLEVSADAASDFATLQDVLDLAESLARDGALFAQPGLPEIIAVRDWACEQVIAQLGGAPPAPWPGTAQERFETAVHDRDRPEQPRWDHQLVTASTRPVVAADDANRIIAVSPALAELTGWPAEELKGRRVVTLVPSSFREAHVAGFSRHLSTGEIHLLGEPLTLPVLRRDGSEVTCRLLLEETPASGRRVFLAWIEPVDESPA
jgi:PAS domain S-box-containing protein